MTFLGNRGGPVRRAALAGLLILLAAAGCSAPAEKAPETTAVNSVPAVNEVDIMFLQMGLAQIAEGQELVTLASARAGDPQIRAIADELHGQWASESGTMERWLLGWAKPVTADPSAGAHAGHGDLHALRDTDRRELAAAQGADFDRTLISLLLGNLHNGMETLRMESGSGSYPPARKLATRMIETRQAQIQRLLRLAAGG
ncbi:DUF305 domain-containing protein [Actinoplanes cyaneus]|uniref:DUF305 domain-containing protein n=1 Tax=Actinoplanes cyaneus TaxID=52696 RepID=A0A919IBC2_9ACTN|nr:DUF305 domain-containing protein [Actinoplanes cyaneus]MCW2136013.1 Uncharacterized conserved protein, DUF305 family [Actinoplanes cyaneus]GID62619.1 DUF305 domain-containing protein [Actinoplanes cyaneus]